VKGCDEITIADQADGKISIQAVQYLGRGIIAMELYQLKHLIAVIETGSHRGLPPKRSSRFHTSSR